MKQVTVHPYSVQERPHQKVVSGYRDDILYVLEHSEGAIFKGVLVWNTLYKNHCLSGVDHENRPCHLKLENITKPTWTVIDEIKYIPGVC